MGTRVEGIESVVSIDGSELAAASARARRELDSVENSMARVSRQAQASAPSFRQYQQGLELLTRGSISFNQEGGAFVDSAGQQVSALQVLNRVGVQTEGQIRAQIAALQDLRDAYQNNATASSQLAAQEARLQARLQGSDRAAGASARVFFSLGRIVEGSGVSMRAVANDLIPFTRNLSLVRQEAQSSGATVTGTLISALKGPAGLGVALAVVSTAFIVFRKEAKESKEELRDLESAARGAVSGLIEITDVQSRIAKVTLSEARSVQEEIAGQRRELEGLQRPSEEFKDAIGNVNAQLGISRRTGGRILTLMTELGVSAGELPEAIREEIALLKEFDKGVGGIIKREELRLRIQEKLQAENINLVTTDKNRRASLSQILSLQQRIRRELGLELGIVQRLSNTYGEIFTRRTILDRRPRSLIQDLPPSGAASDKPLRHWDDLGCASIQPPPNSARSTLTTSSTRPRQPTASASK